MKAIADAAYFAACLESADHMRALPPDGLRLTMPGLTEAAERLRDNCGVAAWTISGDTSSTPHEYDGTQLQRVVMRRVHDFMAVRWRRWATPLERAWRRAQLVNHRHLVAMIGCGRGQPVRGMCSRMMAR
eukprot:6416540-Karenia_brevis.AAC.1